VLPQRLDRGRFQAAGDRATSGGLARSAFGTLTLRATYAALSFGTAVVLARLLGVNGYGVYAYGVAWAGLLGVPAVLGFDRLVVREMATYLAEERWALIRGLLRRSNQVVGVVSACLALGSALVALAVLAPDVGHTFAIAMVLVPLTALTLLRQASLQGLNRPVLSQLPEFLIRPLMMIVLLGALWLFTGSDVGPATAMSINVAVTVFAFLVGAFLLQRNAPSAVKTTAPDFDTRMWISAAMPMMVITGVWVLNGYVGTIMLGSLVDARSAGIFAVTSRGADLVTMALLAVNVPLAPRLARLYAAGDHVGLQQLVSKAVKMAFLWSLPLAVGLIVLRDVYLGFFGDGFGAGGSALIILVAGQLVNVAAGPVGILLLMTGWELQAALGVACGLVINIALNAALDPVLGVTGAAVAALASTVCWNLGLAVFSARRLGIYPTVAGRRLPAFKR
jgi:O-antigen/teichoic acid export membrane protein